MGKRNRERVANIKAGIEPSRVPSAEERNKERQHLEEAAAEKLFKRSGILLPTVRR